MSKEETKTMPEAVEYSWIELTYDCPLTENDCDIKKGESSRDHEQYCNEDLDYNHIIRAFITGNHYEKARAGDSIKFIEMTAYSALKDECEQLKESDVINTKALRDLYESKISLLEQDLESEKRSHQITKDSSNEYIEELKQHNEELIEALEYYTNRTKVFDGEEKVAMQALAKIKDGENV